MNSLLSVIIGLLVVLVILAVWMLVDIARINRPPASDDYPISRKGDRG